MTRLMSGTNDTVLFLVLSLRDQDQRLPRYPSLSEALGTGKRAPGWRTILMASIVSPNPRSHLNPAPFPRPGRPKPPGFFLSYSNLHRNETVWRQINIIFTVRAKAMETNNRAYTSTAVEVYRRETQEVFGRFLSHQLSFPDCVVALHSALGRLLPTLEREQFDEVRFVMLANNDTVMDEMARRSAKPKASSERTL